jgi:hypothetical protein
MVREREPLGAEMFGAGVICSELDSEHLIVSSEHLATLRRIAVPAGFLPIQTPFVGGRPGMGRPGVYLQEGGYGA